jgi:hypothetical protein
VLKKDSAPARYIIKAEPAPDIKPRWWRSMWEVLDLAASTRHVVKRFRTFSAAETMARCLNQRGTACTETATNLHVEVWGWAA